MVQEVIGREVELEAVPRCLDALPAGQTASRKAPTMAKTPGASR